VYNNVKIQPQYVQSELYTAKIDETSRRKQKLPEWSSTNRPTFFDIDEGAIFYYRKPDQLHYGRVQL